MIPEHKTECVVIFDLDGCLSKLNKCATEIRLNWADRDASERAMNDCQPNVSMISLFSFMRLYFTGVMLVMTGRPESYREITMKWLTNNGVKPHDIWMRKNGDMRPDAEVKRDHLVTLRQMYDIWFVVEDRASVVKMWREEGVTCLQCEQGDY